MERGAAGRAYGHIFLCGTDAAFPLCQFLGSTTLSSWAPLSHFTGEEIEVPKGKTPASGDFQASPIESRALAFDRPSASIS